MKKSLISFMFAVLLVFVGLSTNLIAQTDGALRLENGGSIVKVMDDIHISEEMVVNGDVVAIMGDIGIDGRVRGDVVSVMGDIRINNKVDGNVISIMGRMKEGPMAQIHGDIIQVIGGRNIVIGGKDISPPFGQFFRWSFRISRLIILLALVVLTYALLPKQEEAMALALSKNPIKKFVKGLVTLLAMPLVFIITLLSILGIPLIPFIVVAFVIAMIIGYVGVALFVGNRINDTAKTEMNVYIRLLIGVIILWLLRLVL